MTVSLWAKAGSSRSAADLVDSSPGALGHCTGERSVLAGNIEPMSPDFPTYAPSEEHELLRSTVRELADA
ncbi:hypothetical protein ACFHW2_22270, partial [Actinomadura sp. LOL_016]|uniref:hypothetical protein n=1 Tax=Actinomadura sp. LOL_016 TaxID=3345411 RepID=UPI003A895526